MKLKLFCSAFSIALLMMTFTSSAYGGCISGNCYNGQGTMTMPNGAKYVGEFKDSKYHGQGTVTMPDGGKYVGEWKDGNLHGQGTMTYADGTTWTGEWRDGEKYKEIETAMERIMREVEEKRRRAELIQQEKEKRIKSIENLFAKLEDVDKMKESVLSSESKVEAWSEFINQYLKDNPKFGDATKRLEHWQKMARLPVKERKKMPCPAKMSFIPGGVFLAGEVDSLKEMSINAFCMDKYEVTQAEYERVIGRNPSELKGVNRPVENVSWHEAKAYCKKLGKHLPTEWEWEKAAKAGTTTKYYWGDEPSSTYAWLGDKMKDGNHHPVGQKKPNAFGLYDMSGNVSEWTDSDYYDKTTINFESNGKVVRSGYWYYGPNGMESANRGMGGSMTRFNKFGFRCAK